MLPAGPFDPTLTRVYAHVHNTLDSGACVFHTPPCTAHCSGKPPVGRIGTLVQLEMSEALKEKQESKIDQLGANIALQVLAWAPKAVRPRHL